MQISKSLLVVCAAALVIPLAVCGRDTEAQKKAREALDKKMSELGAQPAQPASPAPAPTPKSAPKAAPPPPVAPAPTPTTVKAAPPPAPPASATAADPESIAKARSALRQKLDEMNSPGTVPAAPTPTATSATPPPPPVAVPAPVAAPPPTPAPAAVVAAPPPPALTAPPSDPEAIAKAREALRQKMQELEAPAVPAAVVATPAAPVVPAAAPIAAQPPVAAPAAPPAAAPAVAAVDPAEIAKAREAMRKTMLELPPLSDEEQLAEAQPKSTKAGFNFPPLVGPALPISTEKQQRLMVLLQRYKVDQVTPEQYQSERAKILAEQ